MRRSVVDHVGGQKQLAHTHDMEMWLRIAAHSDIGYVSGSDQAGIGSTLDCCPPANRMS